MKKLKLICYSTSLLLTMLLLVMLSFGWYAVNKTANVENATGLVGDDGVVQFEDTVLAKIYYLNGNITTETYTRESNGDLYLTKREYYIEEGTPRATENYTVADNQRFFVRSLLPGEYVDVTIGYHMKDEDNGSGYSIGFMDVTGGSFQLDGKTHYATGAYKWKSVSLKSGSINGTVVNDFSTANYSWFNTYNIASNDETNLRITTHTHTWNTSYGKLFYTFRIFEDFTEYYRLVGQSSTYTGDALLSFLTLNIGRIYVLV